MIRIYQEQLHLQLANKLYSCYLVFGKNYFLVQESINKICQTAKQKGFTERYDYLLDINIDWDAIYNIGKSNSLLANKQILVLILPENVFSTTISEKLFKLIKLLHTNLLLILYGNKLTKVDENSHWFRKIGNNGVYVNCLTPTQSKLNRWVTQQAETMSISLDRQANQLLCYHYEDDLLSINQALKQLSLLYPNNNITINHVKEIVNNAITFTIYQWIDALLSGKIKRSWYIIQQLKHENYEITFLLHTLQRELLLLLMFKQQNNHKNFKKIFNQYKIWPSRHHLIINALQRLSLNELQYAVQLANKAELDLKQDYGNLIWLELETLSILLCGKLLPESFINV